MSAEPRPLPPTLPPDPAVPVSRDSWPRMRLASAALLLVLAAGLAVPVLAAAPSPALAVALLVPVLAGVLTARHAFASRTLRRDGHVTVRVLLDTIPPAVLAVAIVAGTSLVGGVRLSWTSLAIALGITEAVLILAAALRGVEIRYLLNARRIFLVSSVSQRRDVTREIGRMGGMALVGSASLGVHPLATDSLGATIAVARPTMLVLSDEAARLETVVAAASAFHAAGGRVRDLNGFYARHFRKVPLSELTPSWFLFDVAEIHRPRAYLAVRRALEVVLALLGLIIVMPVLALAALAVRLSSSGPVLFRQARVGRGGVAFDMLKLRTMRLAEPGAPARWASQDLARITPVGRVLRRWRIDELPQLINVLLGHLSLVGPRPEQVALVRELEDSIEFYSARHRVRPGLTGWAQVNYGYGGSQHGTLEKLQFDFYYIRHQSLRLDLLILVMTLRAILRGGTE